MIFRLNIRICFKSGAKLPLFCRKSVAIVLKFVVNQGQLGKKSSKRKTTVCLIREKVVTFRMVKLNMLLSIFLITK